MKKLGTAFLVLILLLGLFGFSTSNVKAQGSAPEWTIGDYWEYFGQGDFLGQMVNITMRFEVMEKVTVEIGDVSYETHRCALSISISYLGTSITATGDAFFRTSDLAEVKIFFTFMGESNTITYDPPQEVFWFPLSNGKSWNSTSTQTTISDGNTDTDVITIDYSVSGPETLTVQVGSYTCFRVTGQEIGGSISSTTYYSDAVGYAVRISGIAAGFEMDSPLDLIAFNYQKSGFIIMLLTIIIIIAVIIIAISAGLIMLRRKTKMPPPIMPQEPIYGQPPQQPPQYRPPPQP